MIFVFGSNLSGIHGAGAALFAKQNHRAVQGIGNGRQGNSYGIPTKDYKIKTLPLKSIQTFVDEFKEYASRSQNKFKVTAIGTGLAGYSHKAIAEMFIGATLNCVFDIRWKRYLGDKYEYFK